MRRTVGWMLVLCGAMLVGEERPLSVLFVVGDSGRLSLADSMLEARFRAVGLEVIRLDDDRVGPQDAEGSALVFISESVLSSKVEGVFQMAPIPVWNMEPFSWDVDCFVDTTLDVPFGRTAGPDGFQLEVADATWIASAWRSGDRLVYYEGSNRSRDKLGWAIPAGEAKTFLRIPQSDRAVAFGYESGSEMANGFRAPARRLAFALQDGVADSLSPVGWEIVYTLLNWCLEPMRSPTIQTLFVVKGSPWHLTLGDLIVWQRLLNRGHVVDLIGQERFFGWEVSRYGLVVISESVDFGMAPDLYALGVPILNCELSAYAITTPWVASLEGISSRLTDRMIIVDPGHPIMGWFGGEIRISSRPTFWGSVLNPGGDASVLARFEDPETPPAALFAYTKTARLIGGRRMAARFVGFPFQVEAPPWATATVWELWDRSVSWLLTPDTSDARVSASRLPMDVSLDPPYPNPFNAEVEITYSLPRRSFVTLTVYDLAGREVIPLVRAPQEAGDHRVRFHAHGMPSGLYLCRLEAEGRLLARRMLLLR